MKKSKILNSMASLVLACVLFMGSLPVSAGEIQQDSAAESEAAEVQEFSETMPREGEDGTEADQNLQDMSAVDEQENTEMGEVPEDVTDVTEESQETGETDDSKTPQEESTSEEIFSSGETDIFTDDTNGDQDTGLTEEERAAQLAPMENLSPISVVDPPTTAEGVNGRLRSFSSAPSISSYDTRGILTTAVKNQQPYETCWAFTTAAGMETSLLKRGEGLLDLSEEHLAYFFANRQNDPLGNTSGDQNILPGDYHSGGNQVLGAIFLTSWSGMALESQVPYPAEGGYALSNTTVPSTGLAYSASAYLTDAVFTSYSVSRIKELIYQYGSVGIALLIDSSFYDPEKCSYSYPYAGNGANHAVTLVGWDDSYSKDNFTAGSGVSGNGAWIAKNSWGEGWGDGGYFYISYENKSNYNIVAEEATTSLTYNNNYFYDGSCALSTLDLCGKGSTEGAASFANVFTATAGKGNGEVLGEVVLATYSDGNYFGIQIYTNLTDSDDPTSGIPAYSSPVEYYQEYAGISTVQVPEVTLAQGTKYSVVVTNLGLGTTEYLCETEADHGWVSFRAGLAAGQSFAWNAAEGWSDLYEDGMCMRIKAHTRSLSTPVTLTAPSGLRVSKTSYTRVDLSWQAVSGVSGYEIYRKAADGSWTRLQTVDAETLSYQDKEVACGTVYAYKIRAYSQLDGKKLYSSFSGEVKAKPALSTPSVTVKVSSGGYNKISWNKVSGAQGYLVYRRLAGKRWKCVAMLTGASQLTYTDRKISAATVYEYAVRAYRSVSGTKVKSWYKSSGKYKSAAATQRVSSVTSSRYGLRIRWKAQKNCDGYFIYRKKGSGKWQQVAKLTKGTRSVYFDNTVRKGRKYTYAVRAYVKVPYGVVSSRYVPSKAVVK